MATFVCGSLSAEMALSALSSRLFAAIRTRLPICAPAELAVATRRNNRHHRFMATSRPEASGPSRSAGSSPNFSGQEPRHAASILHVGAAEPFPQLSFFQWDDSQHHGQPRREHGGKRRRSGQQPRPRYRQNHAGIPRMSHASVDSPVGKRLLPGSQGIGTGRAEFGQANQPPPSQVGFHSTHQPKVQPDQQKTEQHSREGYRFRDEKEPAKTQNTCRAKAPHRNANQGVGKTRPASPEIRKGMDKNPENRDRQLGQENHIDYSPQAISPPHPSPACRFVTFSCSDRASRTPVNTRPL